METLLEKIQQLELKNKELEEKLQKYTNSDGHKRYYEKNKETVIQKANDENHKEELIQKNKEYKEKTNYVYEVSPEKKKEYARRAYLNKKKKLLNQENNT